MSREGVSVCRKGVCERREGGVPLLGCLAVHAWCRALRLLLLPLLTDLWPSASLAVIRFFGSTISRLRTKSFASAEMGSQ